MYIVTGKVSVSATVDVRGDTDMDCVVDRATGRLELTLGNDPYAQIVLTEHGTDKLISTIQAARSHPAT